MRALQVIGDPVLHSLSPKIHGAMLSRLGLDIPYTARVVRRGELSAYLTRAAEEGIVGFNATMPHKEELLPLLDGVEEYAARLGAVNTVVGREGKWMGYNTDGEGCLAALTGAGLWPARRVVVLGAGGAAKAMATKLALSGAEQVWVCNRTLERAQALCTLPNMTAAGFDTETLRALCAGADLLVNGTNLGMEGSGQFADLSFVDALPRRAGVFDAIYHPARTQLLGRAEERGLQTCNGLPMLVHQAIFALEHFLGRELDHGEMETAIYEAI